MTTRARLTGRILVGLLLGFGLGGIGFGDYGQLHGMFTLTDFRLLLTFASAVALSALGFALLARRSELPRRTVHKGSILGGVLFGTGWVLSGACPGIVLVQLGEGKLVALVTGAAILAGSWVYGKLDRDVLHWSTPTCGS